MRVAVGQLAAVAGDVETNVATAIAALGEARGAQLLVLPELFLTGYSFAPVTLDPADRRLVPLAEAAAAAGTTVLAGAAVHGEPRPTVSTLAFGPGGVAGIYDKQHLCGEEQDWFTPGDSGAVLEIAGVPVATAICYDACFPEHGRAAAEAGALVYAPSVAYYRGSEHRRDLYHRARAVDNGFFVAVGALVGACGGAEFGGGSMIIDPEGRVLTSVVDGERGVAVADLDLEEVAATRAAHPMLAERRRLPTIPRPPMGGE